MTGGRSTLPLESRGTPLSINAYGQWIVTMRNISLREMLGT
jgi:hypothetical protein